MSGVNYSGRKLSITVLLANSLFEGKERLDAIGAVTKTKDRLIDMAQQKRGIETFSDDARRQFVVRSASALMASLDEGSTSFSQAEMQNALIENLLYLIGKLPAQQLRSLHGVIVVPQENGAVEFTPYEARAEYEDVVGRLRAAYQGGGETEE